MYTFSTPEMEVELLLDSLSAAEHTGPKRTLGSWETFTLKQKEDHFVYLRLALEHAARDPSISEEAITLLLEEYEAVFAFLANTESKLRTALLNKTHAFFMPSNQELVAHFKSLMIA